MITSTRIAGLALIVLLLTTAGTQAFGPRESRNVSLHDGLQDAIDSNEERDIADAMHDAIDEDEARDAEGNIQDWIKFRPNDYRLNDAVLGPDGKLSVKEALAAGLLKLSCRVDDGSLVIANTGALALPGKTRLRWTVAALDETGTLMLKTELVAGASVRTANIVNGADAVACTIKVLG